MATTRKPWYVWVLLILLAMTWGSSFILMKRGLDAFTSQQVACLRIFIAFLVIWPFWFKVKPEEWKGNRKWYILIVTLTASFIPAFLFTAAETKIASSLAGVLNSLTPVFTIITGYFLFKIKTRRIQALGVVIGLIGAVSVIVLRPDGSFEYNFKWSLLVVLATFLYSVSSNTIKSKLAGVTSMTIATIGFSITGPIAGLYLIYSGFIQQVVHQEAARQALPYMLILGALGTAYASFVYYFLIQKTSPIFASVVTYLMPLVAVMWGLIDREPLGLVHVVGMILILIGVWLTSK